MNDVAKSDWLKTNTAKHSKEVWRNYSNKKTKLLVQLNRIVAFTTGHGRFKAHLTKMQILSETKCKYCDEDEMANHIMCDCDGLAALRQRTIAKMYCELSEYARIDFYKYRQVCNCAFVRIRMPINE